MSSNPTTPLTPVAMVSEMRMTPEREKEIKDGLYFGNTTRSWLERAASELVDALSAVRRERDEAVEWRDVWGSDVNRWNRLYAECTGDIDDAALGRLVRQMARQAYLEEVTTPQRPATGGG
jgi:hypothetical protein